MWSSSGTRPGRLVGSYLSLREGRAILDQGTTPLAHNHPETFPRTDVVNCRGVSRHKAPRSLKCLSPLHPRPPARSGQEPPPLRRKPAARVRPAVARTTRGLDRLGQPRQQPGLILPRVVSSATHSFSIPLNPGTSVAGLPRHRTILLNYPRISQARTQDCLGSSTPCPLESSHPPSVYRSKARSPKRLRWKLRFGLSLYQPLNFAPCLTHSLLSAVWGSS